jgi:hypothetical protein
MTASVFEASRRTVLARRVVAVLGFAPFLAIFVMYTLVEAHELWPIPFVVYVFVAAWNGFKVDRVTVTEDQILVQRRGLAGLSEQRIRLADVVAVTSSPRGALVPVAPPVVVKCRDKSRRIGHALFGRQVDALVHSIGQSTKQRVREASDIGTEPATERAGLDPADYRRLAGLGAMLVGSGIALATIFGSWLYLFLSLPGVFVLLSLTRASR